MFWNVLNILEIVLERFLWSEIGDLRPLTFGTLRERRTRDGSLTIFVGGCIWIIESALIPSDIWDWRYLTFETLSKREEDQGPELDNRILLIMFCLNSQIPTYPRSNQTLYLFFISITLYLISIVLGEINILSNLQLQITQLLLILWLIAQQTSGKREKIRSKSYI